MDTTQVVGIIAGVLTSASMVPQLFKMFKEKKSEDVSSTMLFILFAGLGTWIAYGIMKNDIPIMATNAFSLLINIFLLILRFKYSK